MTSDNMWQSVVITNVSTPRARACTSSTKVVRRISLLSPALQPSPISPASELQPRLRRKEKAAEAQAPAAGWSQDTGLKTPASVHISNSARELAAYTTVY